MSLNATGSLAKSIVFAGWKGIKYARQYIVPANPNTSGQQTQRGYITAAVALWHSILYPLNTLDKGNLDRGANNSGVTMSGFNLFTRNYTKSKVAGATPNQIYDTVEASLNHNGPQITAKSVASVTTVKLRWGVSPTAMLNLVTRTEAAAAGTTHTFDLAAGTAGQVVFYQVYDLVESSQVTLGIGRITLT
jgi:hypothetical protein